VFKQKLYCVTVEVSRMLPTYIMHYHGQKGNMEIKLLIIMTLKLHGSNCHPTLSAFAPKERAHGRSHRAVLGLFVMKSLVLLMSHYLACVNEFN
jgi:hypothetical protein